MEENNPNNKKTGRKPSIITIILLCIVIVLLVICIFLMSKILFSKNEIEDDNTNNSADVTQDNQEDKNTESKAKLDLDINGDFVQSLYKKIPLQVRGYEPYNDGITKYEDISDNNKLLYTIRTLESEYSYSLIKGDEEVFKKLSKTQMMDPATMEIKKFDFNTVEEKYKNIFGPSNNVPLISAETTLGYVYDYVPQDNCYYGHAYAGGGGQDFTPYPTIESCEQNDDGTEVYIYDRFISFDTDDYVEGQITKYALYDRSWPVTINTNERERKIVGQLESEYDSTRGISLFNGKTIEELLEEYKDKAGKFKHTYKLDSAGNYYWYSSEKIN